MEPALLHLYQPPPDRTGSWGSAPWDPTFLAVGEQQGEPRGPGLRLGVEWKGQAGLGPEGRGGRLIAGVYSSHARVDDGTQEEGV